MKLNILEKDTIHIGTLIRHTKLDEYWTITDLYFNLHNNGIIELLEW